MEKKNKVKKRKKRPDFKISGVITEIDSKKIHIVLNFPYTDLNYKYKDTSAKLIELDKRMKKELSGIRYDEEVENIRFYKPYYFKIYRDDNRTIKDMFVKLNAPKRYLSLYNLGSMVEIVAFVKTYNFDDPDDKKQKIRGWSMNIKYMKYLAIER